MPVLLNILQNKQEYEIPEFLENPSQYHVILFLLEKLCFSKFIPNKIL